jgi:hypothetical protein
MRQDDDDEITTDTVVDHPARAATEFKRREDDYRAKLDERDRKEKETAREHRKYLNLTRSFREAAATAQDRRRKELWNIDRDRDDGPVGDGEYEAHDRVKQAAVPQELRDRRKAATTYYSYEDVIDLGKSEDDPSNVETRNDGLDREGQTLEYYMLEHQIEQAELEAVHKLDIAVETAVLELRRRMYAEACGFDSWQALSDDVAAAGQAADEEAA